MYQTTSVQILSPEGISAVGRPDYLPSLIYRSVLKPSREEIFYYRTVTLWNALKPHFKLSESLIIFKRKMKAFLLNQFLMS